jgi:hypothetical protein
MTLPHAAPVRARSWSDSERDQVKALLAKGASAGVIAAEMGINRNQVIGRVHRDPEMELVGYAAKALKRIRIRAKKPQPLLEKPLFKSQRLPVKKAPAGAVCVLPVTVVPPVPDAAHAMALLGTSGRWCKWPILEDPQTLGGHLCCGQPVEHIGSPWCLYHRYLAKRGQPHG